MRVITQDNLPAKVSCKIAVVVSRFNASITSRLRDGALARLQEYEECKEEDITLVEVPGAVEIPIVVQRLARDKKYDAIIALGAVIRGETTHYDYVCEQVSQGCQHIALCHDIPVIFGVLTTENEAQAFARVGGCVGHKGIEAVDAAMAMISILHAL